MFRIWGARERMLNSYIDRTKGERSKFYSGESETCIIIIYVQREKGAQYFNDKALHNFQLQSTTQKVH